MAFARNKRKRLFLQSIKTKVIIKKKQEYGFKRFRKTSISAGIR